MVETGLPRSSPSRVHERKEGKAVCPSPPRARRKRGRCACSASSKEKRSKNVALAANSPFAAGPGSEEKRERPLFPLCRQHIGKKKGTSRIVRERRVREKAASVRWIRKGGWPPAAFCCGEEGGGRPPRSLQTETEERDKPEVLVGDSRLSLFLKGKKAGSTVSFLSAAVEERRALSLDMRKRVSAPTENSALG